jgi:glutathione peroxidase
VLVAACIAFGAWGAALASERLPAVPPERPASAAQGVAAGAAGPPSHVAASDSPAGDDACPPLLRHAFTPIQGGAEQSFCRYRGKVLLIVNTASQCGYTPQYAGLEALYKRYGARGLVVVGFPSNDFGGQEPGTNKEIAEFCRTVYGVQFPMYEKQKVSHLAANPLYAELAAKTGVAPRWNFHKYVVDRNGKDVTSFASDVAPDDRELIRHIERELSRAPPASRG